MLATPRRTLVATYDSHDGAKGAVLELRMAGLSAKRVSIVCMHSPDVGGAEKSPRRLEQSAHTPPRGVIGSTCLGLLLCASIAIDTSSDLVFALMSPLRWAIMLLKIAAIAGLVGRLVSTLYRQTAFAEALSSLENSSSLRIYKVLVHGPSDVVVHAKVVLDASRFAEPSSGTWQCASHTQTPYDV